MAILKQSTGYTRLFFMVATSDHITGLTGITPTVTLSKAGGAFGAAGGTVTEISSGWYKIVLTTTDTNTLGDLAYHATGTGGDPTDFVDQVSVRLIDDLAYPATSGRSMVVDASGLVDANAVKIGPSGSGSAQTAGDVGIKTGFALTSAYDPAKTASQAGDAMALTSGERNSTADAFLNRDMSTGTDSGSPSVRTVRQALRFCRNKFAIVAGTMTVYKEDDTTASWTSAITTTAGNPVSTSDPA